MRLLRHILVAAALVAAGASGAVAGAPERVVSMNVCTDQLAMLVAAPGQLVSISHLTRDPATSALAEEARAYPIHHGQAEEIFLLEPDLVIAGTTARPTTLSMLRRLGVRVEQMPSASTLGEIRDNIAHMGELLGQPERARDLVARFDERLRAVRGRPYAPPLAAPYYANGFSSGGRSLAAAVIEAAGYENLGTRLGLEGTAPVPLEVLLMHDPALLILGTHDYDAPAKAQEIFAHPALERAFGRARRIEIANSAWVCGGPFTADAVEALALRRSKTARAPR
ncbi:ABC transporter substrate-binding protein [Lutibaculum baratangense]|uniref:Vitamin B12 ABC transporter, B12-binding component BtuF n=1 Tax=Lutibaculum baratangense AMV1 TaxID=631454 RepID=V4RME8_9HYPH|nr:ABC transporter substrate-binding protein [Lutibaculum baratangense]ESR26449.1 Vitamin B12 ABC transporter, B12-binding component BtuF [Lutibaculum baratangense AMV1]